MRLRSIAVAAALASPLAMIAGGPATAATPAVAGPIAGFAWIDGPGTAGSTTTYDSAGGTISATENTSGFFTVTFGGLAFSGGDVQVSGLDPQGSCVVEGWNPSGGDLVVNVACYHLGVPSDEQFDILVTQPRSTPAGVLDYAWMNRSTSSGKLTGGYDYNSSHKTNSVTHKGLGRYLVTLPGPAIKGANTGTVKASAYGGGAGSCQIASWKGTKTAQLVGVDCFNSAGAPQNRDFTIEYARGNNLMGLGGQVDANALANGKSAVYQPAVQYDSTRGARVTVVHLDTGYYEVVAAGSSPTRRAGGGDGDAQVTTVGTSPVTCGFYELGTHQPAVYVNCSNPAGHPANAAFTFQWVVKK
jgi:hypothetical protein